MKIVSVFVDRATVASEVLPLELAFKDVGSVRVSCQPITLPEFTDRVLNDFRSVILDLAGGNPGVKIDGSQVLPLEDRLL